MNKIDYDIVEKLANIQCTIEEIAAVLSCDIDTLNNDQKFIEIYNNGLKTGKSNLRKLQFKQAAQGNSAMLVWLGKQYLNQAENNEKNNK